METAVTTRDLIWNDPPITEERGEFEIRYKRWACGHSDYAEIEQREQISFAVALPADTSVLPGVALNPINLRRQRNLELLEGLIWQFALFGMSWGSGPWARVSLDARDAGISFIRGLGSRARLPKVTPDGEGNLLLVWEKVEGPLMVVVDGPRVHMVKRAATPQSEHIADLPFINGRVPAEVLCEVPPV
jgi:hypothetical protein